MGQALALIFGLLLSPDASLPSQVSFRSEAKLVHRYESRCGYSCAQELASDLGGVYGTNPNDTVAVRFCSNEPLAVALLTSAADYRYVITILQGSYGYTPARILFLRSKGCLGSTRVIATTEFWVIPKGATLPPSVESRKSSQVRIDSFGMKGLIGNSRTFKVALQKLPAKLRINQEAIGVVVGYYYNQPSKAMKQRIVAAQKILERSRVPPDRYFVRLTPWTGEQAVDPPDPESNYPSVFVVEIEGNRVSK